MSPTTDITKQTIDNLIKLRWDVGMLNKLIGYVIKRSNYITSLNLRNVQKLLMGCDFTEYKNRPIVTKRVDFILKAIHAKLKERYESESIVIQYCTPDVDDPVTTEILKNIDRYKALNYAEINFVTKFVEDRLMHGVFINKICNMKNIIDKVENGEFESYRETNQVVKGWIREYLAQERNIVTSQAQGMLDFNDPKILEKTREIVNRLGDMSAIIITGIQMFNEMLSPGFRPAKLYVFLGLTGGFKSAMLLKIIIDSVKYNAKTYKPKTEGAKPYVVYITMENTIDESFARIWNMVIEDSDVEKSKPEDIVNRLKKAKIVCNDEMGILFVYRPVASMTTADLRDLIDEILATGKEIALLSFDYIKRILPEKKSFSEKEELKNITNELRRIAIDYGFSLVTAHQFNRNQLAVINAKMREGESDLAKYMGGENVGSAYEVMENADMTIALNLERKKDTGILYLTFYRLKERYRPSTKLTYFNQPFAEDNEFRLVDDILLPKPLGIISLDINMEGADANKLFNTRGRGTHKNLFMDKGMKTDEIFDLEPV